MTKHFISVILFIHLHSYQLLCQYSRYYYIKNNLKFEDLLTFFQSSTYQSVLFVNNNLCLEQNLHPICSIYRNILLRYIILFLFSAVKYMAWDWITALRYARADIFYSGFNILLNPWYTESEPLFFRGAHVIYKNKS